MIKYVIDACALIAFLHDEAGAEQVEKLLKEAETNKAKIFLHSITLYEVYYGVYRESGQVLAETAMRAVVSLPIEIVDEFGREYFELSAYFKTNYRMSMADSVMLGVAMDKSAVVVSADHHEFDPIDLDGDMKFLWIR